MCCRVLFRLRPECRAGERRIRWGFACFRLPRWCSGGCGVRRQVGNPSLGAGVAGVGSGMAGVAVCEYSFPRRGASELARGGPRGVQWRAPWGWWGECGLSLHIAVTGRAGVHRTARLGGPVYAGSVGFTGIWRGGPPPMCGAMGGRGPYPTDTVISVCGVVGGRGPDPTGTVVASCGVVGGRGPDPTIKLLSVSGALSSARGWYPIWVLIPVGVARVEKFVLRWDAVRLLLLLIRRLLLAL